MQWEGLCAIVLYLIATVSVGIYFFRKSLHKGGSEKEYFLGGRSMNGWVSALSAGASDMSAWVLMGLPGTIYALGMGQVWIAIGLLIGTIAAWITVAPKLRRYSIIAGDSITIPQFLSNRFLTQSKSLQVIAAIVFMITYCIYAASSIYACGLVFNATIGMNSQTAMAIAATVIVFYTFLGGFQAVCWTDFFQGMMMLAALMATPIIAFLVTQGDSFVHPDAAFPANYFQWFPGGSDHWVSFHNVVNGIAWGLGYFGMPHILIRYFAIKSEKEMKKSQIIGCSWITVILLMAVLVGLMGRYYLGVPSNPNGPQMVFVDMVRKIFEWIGTQTGMVSASLFFAGLLLSAILAASMSSADSQLLISSSAFASDIYKPVFRKKASDKEMMWAGRIIVFVMTVIAYLIAANPNCKGIMSLVSCAWGAFGAAFGPVILLALYWRRLTCLGAAAGIAAGFCVDGAWYVAGNVLKIQHTGILRALDIYEILPGFLCGLIAAVIVSKLDKAPSQEVCDLFDKASSNISE